MVRHGKARHGKASEGKVRQGRAREVKARKGKAMQVKERKYMTSEGQEWKGMSSEGKEWKGKKTREASDVFLHRKMLHRQVRKHPSKQDALVPLLLHSYYFSTILSCPRLHETSPR
jgi:hypothetical protein